MAIKIYSQENGFLVHNAKNILSAEGIAVEVRNDTLRGIMGDMPPTECWPELWLLNPEDKSRAAALLAQLESPIGGSNWLCQACLETNEPNFELCWNCQSDRPLEAAVEL